jgi:phosphonopyruvate decarboxylase
VIEAEDFVEAARRRGFEWYTGVPCSFLTPFINYVINNEDLSYLSSANEGDAVATAAGLTLGGKRAIAMMQNSGLGNAVSPLTSLTWTFRIPILLICTHRGAPGLKDEPQHELMGSITPELFESMQIPWEYFPDQPDQIEAALQRADEYMGRENRPYALLMKKGTVAEHALDKQGIERTQYAPFSRQQFQSADGTRNSRHTVLSRLIEQTDSHKTVLIGSTGFTGRELYSVADRDNHLYMVGSMGCASALALGLSLARPDLKVIVIDGDGAALMRMGNFATLGTYGADNLVHLLLDNEAHDSTGAQATVTAGVSFAGIAEACGYAATFEGDQLALIDAVLNTSARGPVFGHLKIRTGAIEGLPRPKITPVEIRTRLMQHIGSTLKVTT